MPVIGTLTSGSLSPTGIAQQAMIAVLKATTAISGSSFEVQQTVSGPAGAFIGGRNSSIPGHSSFAADGDYLVTGDGDFSNVYVWNLSDGSLHMTVAAPSLPSGTGSWGWQIDIHGDYFIAGNGGDYATVHNVSTGALITTITGAARNVAINENYAVGVQLGGFSPGSGAGTIKVFELATSTLTYLADPNYDSSEYFGGGIQMMDISGDNLILSPNNGPIVTVHDIPTALSNGNLNTASLTINPTVSYFESLTTGGNYLALGRTSVQDGSILIYDLTTGTLLHTLTAPIGADSDFGDTMHIKGDYLVVGNRAWYGPGANLAAVYDLTTGALLQTFTESDATNTSTWHNPSMGGAFGSAVAITDSKTIIGSRTGAENSSGGGSFIIYSNPSQAAESAAPASSGWTFDLSNVTYDSVSFSVNQDNNPASIAFNNDGTKMYMMGGFHKNIHQYTLSTGFDLSTASYDTVHFYVGSQDNAPQHMKFNNDGTKMYISGMQRDKIHQYSLTTGFDLSTASYDNVTFVLPAFTYGFTFNNDGTKMYSNGDSGTLRQHSLTTAFDLSTASYDNVNFSASQSHSPNDMWFNSDGTKMYILFAGGEDDVHQYSLTTGFDMSTASYDNVSFSVGSQETNPTGLVISSDGTKMYAVGANNDTVYQYTTGSTQLSAPVSSGWTFDLSNVSYDNASVSLYSELPSGVYRMIFNNDGTKMYAVGNTSSAPWHKIAEYSLSTAYDITTSSYNNVDLPITSQISHPVSIRFNNDGTKLYIIGGDPRRISQYSLSVAFDLSTATYSGVDIDPGDGHSLHFNPDGTKMYTVRSGSGTGDVKQYSLSTGFDISTASYDNISFDVTSQMSSPSDIIFNPDGTKMYINDYGTKNIFQYSLSSGFDLSTASYDNASFLVSQQHLFYGMAINGDGTKLYTTGSWQPNVDIHQYSTGL